MRAFFVHSRYGISFCLRTRYVLPMHVANMLFCIRSWNQPKRNQSTSTGAWAQADPSLLRENRKRSNKESYELFHVQQVRAEIISCQIKQRERDQGQIDSEGIRRPLDINAFSQSTAATRICHAVQPLYFPQTFSVYLSWVELLLLSRKVPPAPGRAYFSSFFHCPEFFSTGKGVRRTVHVCLSPFTSLSFCQCNAKFATTRSCLPKNAQDLTLKVFLLSPYPASHANCIQYP